MSNFTNRLSARGSFTHGLAVYDVMKIEGAFVRCVQVRNADDGELIDDYELEYDNQGECSNQTLKKITKDVLFPESHPVFDTVKAQIADLDNQNHTLCQICIGNAVNPQDMVGACPQCLENVATINYLKSL